MNDGSGQQSYSRTKNAVWLAIVAGLACWVGAALLVPLVGGGVSWRAILSFLGAGPQSGSSADAAGAVIFWQTRLPRVLLGLLTGGALAVAGLVFQAVLRNALAEPYILGVSGGAAFGKAIATILALGGATRFFALTPLACFAGAVIPLLVLQSAATRARRFSAATLLLGGVVLNVFFASLILLLQYFADVAQVKQMYLWSMGALDIIGYRSFFWAAPAVCVLFAIVIARGRELNLLSLDTVTAAHLGVDVRRSVNILLWSATLLTSIIVAVSGPIGFVGLMVPHILRMLFGSDNRVLAPLCIVWGGVFLVLCDFVGWRLMQFLAWSGAPVHELAEIPVGVITSLLGGGFFLYLLISRQRNGKWD